MGIRTTFSGSAMIARHDALENNDEALNLIEDVVESKEFDPVFGDEEYA